MEDSNLSNELDTGTTTNVSTNVSPTETETQSAPDTSNEPKSLRDVVAKAFEKHAKPEATEATALPKFPGSSAEPLEADVDPISGRKLDPIKAPGGWTPALREKWGTVDRQVQQFIVDRERDMSKNLQETAEARRLATEFREVVQPYEAILRQNGTTATAHARDLFNIDYRLRSGSPAEKAEVIHSLITHFQPDVQTLMALAQGQPLHQQAGPQLDVRAEVERTLQARQEAELIKQAESHVTAFSTDPANEFFADVEPLMRRAIESGFVHGNSMEEVFKNAYAFACANSPEVQQVLQMRGSMPTNGVAQRPAPRAVGSIKPSMGSGTKTNNGTRPRTLEEAAARAWDDHTK